MMSDKKAYVKNQRCPGTIYTYRLLRELTIC